MNSDRTAHSKPQPVLVWLSLLVASLAIGFFRLRSFDTFWHLVSGRWILEHRTLPHSDPFRFSSINEPWTDHEWLFQTVLAWVDRLFGLDGLIVLRALVVATLATILLLALKRTGVSVLTAFLIALSTLILARLRFLIRPELVSLLGLAVLMATLQRYRRERRLLWLVLLAGVVTVWANAHLGVLIVPPLVALYLVGTRFAGGNGPPNRGSGSVSWPVILGAPLLMIAAISLNPHGLRVFTVPGKIASSLEDLAGINPEWLPLLTSPRPWVFVAMVVLVTIWIIEWRRVGSIDISTALVATALAALTLLSVRHRGLFYVGAAFALAEAIAAIRPRVTGESSSRPRSIWPSLVSAVVVLGCIFPPTWGPFGVRDHISFGFGLEPGRYPVEAVDLASEWTDLGNVFNDVASGGYLLWRWFPERQVFIDGRNEVHPELLAELISAVSSKQTWQALLDRYQIDGAILDYVALPEMVVGTAEPGAFGMAARVPAARSSLYFASDRFALVHFDDVAMLFVRRTAEREEMIRATEFSIVRPDEPGLLMARARDDARFRASAVEELERRVGVDPRSERAESILEALRTLD